MIIIGVLLTEAMISQTPVKQNIVCKYEVIINIKDYFIFL